MFNQETKVRKAIEKNRKNSNKVTIYEVGDWHSVDGEFFQKTNKDGTITEIGPNGHKEVIKPDEIK